MEVYVVLFLIFLGFLVIGSIMGMTASGRIAKLERQNQNLNERLKTLENAQGRSVARAPKPAAPIPVAAKAPDPKPIPKPDPVLEVTPEPIRAAAAAAAAAAPITKSAAAPPVQKPVQKPLSPPTPPAPKKPSRNLEELIGGQWSVWVGGLALLVGAVLLIRFSIEAGIFGPGARILMAFVLGLLLLAAGEWLKRSDDKVLKGKLGEAAKALQGNASVPGLLSAVGIFTLLGTTYAAHELYGFISAPVAFIGLGAIALGAMGLSLRQGPLLAAIGLLASMATPLLIQTDTPNFMALVGYLLVIGFAALALARRTDWRWLETGAVFGWLFWLYMSVAAATSGQLILWSVFLAIGFGLTVWLSEDRENGEEKTSQDFSELSLQPILAVVWGAIAAGLVGYVAATGHSGQTNGFSAPLMTLTVLSIATLCGAAIARRRQCGHLITAGVLAVGLSLFQGPHIQGIIFALMTAVIVVLSIREAFSRDTHPLTKQPDIFWPIFAIGLGLLGVIGSEIFRYAGWSDEIHAGWAFGYAVLFAAAALYFQSKARPVLIVSIFTLGAAAAWTLAAIYAFDGLQLSLALSLGAGIMAAVIWQLRLPGARLALLGLAGLVFAHAFLWQFPDANSLSARPIFNALWVYLALPTAILGVAGYVLHGREAGTKSDEFLNGVIEAAALAGLALFVVFQIRHLSNAGSVYVDSIGFTELGLQVSTGLCFTLAGLSKRFSGNLVLSRMAEIISYVTLAIFAIGSLFALSPLINDTQAVKGNVIFNSLTTGLLVPTALLALCAWRARTRRPDIYINILGGLALVGGMSWVTAMIRYIYNGSAINIFSVNFGDLELWTISVVWLLIGIALLALGVWRKERALRIASGVVIILTVLKAFLIDMAGLEGVLRALSFVALGLILIVIGRAYQRYWLSGTPQEETEEAA